LREEDGKWENDSCKDAKNKREKERSNHEKEMRDWRKDTRNILGSKMHIAPRWVVQKLGCIFSPIASRTIMRLLKTEERCLSHAIFLASILKLEAGKVNDDYDYNV